MKEIINTENAPSAIGPYSQANKANGFVFVSGQLPIDVKTKQFVVGGITEQTLQSLTNLKNILKEADSALENVVKTTVFLSDINNFSEMNAVYSQFFLENCPARSAFEVANLPMSALVEIEAIAVSK